KIRRKELNGEWFFSIIDIVGILTESSIPKRYWADLKSKLLEEGFEEYEKTVRLKLVTEDGKLREIVENIKNYVNKKQSADNIEFITGY
ncbi:MAG: hypothetical protein U9Q06_00165, partial [Nanoarchaeota archaeon]|nr:hypothetical protein [Nanoarchaeota archaeon]